MANVLLDYGDTRMAVELPDSAIVVRYGETYTDPPEVDPSQPSAAPWTSRWAFRPFGSWAGPGKRW